MTIPGVSGRSPAARVAISTLVGVALAVVLYVIGRVHTPDYTIGLFGRTGLAAISLKSLLATVAAALAVVQVVLALWIYGKLPGAGSAPRTVGLTHRTVGAVLVVVTLPVAIHCLLAYGVQLSSLRVAVHSIAGCFFYGAVLAKVLFVHNKRLPGWVLPLAGGLLAVTVVLLWYTSALWYYNGYNLP